MKHRLRNIYGAHISVVVFLILIMLPYASVAGPHDRFERAYAELEAVRREKGADRASWSKVIDTFARSADRLSGPDRERALYMAGKVSLELYRRVKNRSDLKRALQFLREFNRIHDASKKAPGPADPPQRFVKALGQISRRNDWNAACSSAGPPSLSRRSGWKTDPSSDKDSSHVGSHDQNLVSTRRRPMTYGPNPFWNPSMSTIEWGRMLLPHRKNDPTGADTNTGRNAPAFSTIRSGKRPLVIVLDPGHGGKDPGAVSPDGKVLEKELTLRLGKALAKNLIRAHPGISVLLTRNDDRFISLEDRTAFANSHNADLFISIHCNSAEDNSYKGIETYYLSPASSGKALETAARENGISLDVMGDVEATLLDLIVTSKSCESVALARTVHTSMIRNVASDLKPGEDRHIKQAPFYVLLGARMPAILVECGFISNSEDRKRLLSGEYVRELAEGMAAGARSYLKSVRDNT